jgi:hypothetical protein
MAMTKKERAEFDKLILKAETLTALRWTSPIEPDLLPPTEYDKIVQGWSFNRYSMLVSESWSGYCRNGSGIYSKNSSASQGGKKQFSTKILALKAMRHEVEYANAKNLLLIDKMIDAELP